MLVDWEKLLVNKWNIGQRVMTKHLKKRTEYGKKIVEIPSLNFLK